MRLRLTSMTAGLAAGITAAVAVACAVGAYFYSAHHFRTLVASEKTTALAQGEIMRAALEHQMMENVAGVVVLALLGLRRVTLRTYIPFGPFLIVGAVWGILLG